MVIISLKGGNIKGESHCFLNPRFPEHLPAPRPVKGAAPQEPLLASHRLAGTFLDTGYLKGAKYEVILIISPFSAGSQQTDEHSQRHTGQEQDDAGLAVVSGLHRLR